METMTTPEVAELLGISTDLFAKLWQVRQSGYPKLFPDVVRIVGRSNLWDKAQVEQWKADQTY